MHLNETVGGVVSFRDLAQHVLLGQINVHLGFALNLFLAIHRVGDAWCWANTKCHHLLLELNHLHLLAPGHFKAIEVLDIHKLGTLDLHKLLEW